MISRPLLDVQMIGVRAVLSGRAVFDRAEPIVRSADGELFEARRFVGDRVEGEALTEEDLDDLCVGNQATRWPRSVVLHGFTRVWLLRSRFHDAQRLVDELRQRQALEDEQSSFDVWMLVVNEQRAPGVLERWSQDSLRIAGEDLAAGRLQHAAELAERAWLMAPQMTPAIVAMFVHTTRVFGREQRAAGIRAMERNVRGERFDHEVGRELERLCAPPRPAGENARDRWGRESRAVLLRGLGG